MKPDAIIFDFDGVLVESTDIKTKAFIDIYANYGDDVMKQVECYHLQHAGISRFEKFRHIQTTILGLAPLDEAGVAKMATRFADIVIEKVVAAPMVRGARDFLDEHHGKRPMFVVSGTPADELSQIIRRRRFSRYFKAIWGSPGSKAAHIAQLLQIEKLDARQCVMFGDAMADYDGAHANGVPFMGRVAAKDDNPFPADIPVFTDFSRLSA